MTISRYGSTDRDKPVWFSRLVECPRCGCQFHLDEKYYGRVRRISVKEVFDRNEEANYRIETHQVKCPEKRICGRTVKFEIKWKLSDV